MNPDTSFLTTIHLARTTWQHPGYLRSRLLGSCISLFLHRRHKYKYPIISKPPVRSLTQAWPKGQPPIGHSVSISTGKGWFFSLRAVKVSVTCSCTKMLSVTPMSPVEEEYWRIRRATYLSFSSFSTPSLRSTSLVVTSRPLETPKYQKMMRE